MAAYDFVCKKCAKSYRTLSKNASEHPGCGGALERDQKGASASVMDVLDNGLMQKRIERRANIEELVSEYAKSDPRNNR